MDEVQDTEQNLETGETQIVNTNVETEWWEQFGDCYDFWFNLPESEYDYLYWGFVKKKQLSG
jgi:hypothetical protein